MKSSQEVWCLHRCLGPTAFHISTAGSLRYGKRVWRECVWCVCVCVVFGRTRYISNAPAALTCNQEHGWLQFPTNSGETRVQANSVRPTAIAGHLYRPTATMGQLYRQTSIGGQPAHCVCGTGCKRLCWMQRRFLLFSAMRYFTVGVLLSCCFTMLQGG